MNELFNTKKQKILLAINISLILLYFIVGLADFVFYTTFPIVISMIIGLIIPAVVLYFTAPRTNGGCKITYSVWGIVMLIYYIYRGNQQIKGNAYFSELAHIAPETTELRTRMIISVVLSIIVFIIGLEIIYCRKEKKKIKSELRQKSTVHILNIYNVSTKEIRREARSVDVKAYPISQYGYNDEYYVIENIENGNKIKKFSYKNEWDKIVNN